LAAWFVTTVTPLASAASSQGPAGRKVGLAAALQISYDGIKADLLEPAIERDAAINAETEDGSRSRRPRLKSRVG
jgi:hypothetical protein